MFFNRILVIYSFKQCHNYEVIFFLLINLFQIYKYLIDNCKIVIDKSNRFKLLIFYR